MPVMLMLTAAVKVIDLVDAVPAQRRSNETSEGTE